MRVAKLTASGQVTIPEQIRKKLNLKTGDKIMFVESDNAVTIINSSIAAIEKLQSAMVGEAEKAGISDDEDVLALCGDIRKELCQTIIGRPEILNSKDFKGKNRMW
jgi:AbrB family looped-hinge helix DNA binding protein